MFFFVSFETGIKSGLDLLRTTLFLLHCLIFKIHFRSLSAFVVFRSVSLSYHIVALLSSTFLPFFRLFSSSTSLSAACPHRTALIYYHIFHSLVKSFFLFFLKKQKYRFLNNFNNNKRTFSSILLSVFPLLYFSLSIFPFYSIYRHIHVILVIKSRCLSSRTLMYNPEIITYINDNKSSE